MAPHILRLGNGLKRVNGLKIRPLHHLCRWSVRRIEGLQIWSGRFGERKWNWRKILRAWRETRNAHKTIVRILYETDEPKTSLYFALAPWCLVQIFIFRMNLLFGKKCLSFSVFIPEDGECAVSHVGHDSSVGIATRYGLDGPGFEFRLGGRDFPHRPYGPPSLLYNGYRVFLLGKAAGAWR